jgi:hypothetical protein
MTRTALKNFLVGWKVFASSANLLCLEGRLAQSVEHCVHTAGVTGSSPVAPTRFAPPANGFQARVD